MDLAELIKSHKAERTYDELERDCGGSPSSKRLQQLATRPQKNFPDPPTIRALSRGLRVSELVVVLSAAETLGLDIRRATPALLDRLPAGVDRLTEEQTRVLVDMARTFVELNESNLSQLTAIRNMLVHIGVDIRDEEDRPVVGDDALDRFIESLLEDERMQPGSLAGFLQAMQHAEEHIKDVETRGESRGALVVTLPAREPSEPSVRLAPAADDLIPEGDLSVGESSDSE